MPKIPDYLCFLHCYLFAHFKPCFVLQCCSSHFSLFLWLMALLATIACGLTANIFIILAFVLSDSAKKPGLCAVVTIA
ncbi:hypothetical protein L596_025366 [Steinernema carpocapsae]|uniref:Uncharacterized protein n=1 Tax=Steinernema carpocapsae TaxID=34508 RepID=A0A4U5M7J7_STECR|nr:hypothetical protein L596_025366 [Steinernema carpocapsae]